MSAAVSIVPCANAEPDPDSLPRMIFRQFAGRSNAHRRLIYVAYSRRLEIAAVDDAMGIPVLVHRANDELRAALTAYGIRDSGTSVFPMAATAPAFDVVAALHDSLDDTCGAVVAALCFSKTVRRGMLVRVPRALAVLA